MPFPTPAPASAPRRVALLLPLARAAESSLIRGIAQFVRERPGWSIHYDPRGPERSPAEWLRGWRGDGILASPTTRKQELALQAAGLPTIDLSGALANTPFPAVLADNHFLAQLAFTHLHERGSTHFAYCGPSAAQHVYLGQRGEAFAGLAAEAGFPCSVYSFPKKPGRWEREQEQLAGWLVRQRKPLGVFACSDERGYQVLDACRRAGLSVPQEVAVLGVDDDPALCHLSGPALSSIRIDHEQAGYQAAAWLDRLMGGQSPPAQPILFAACDLVIRSSTDTFAFDDPAVNRVLRFIREHACEGIQVRDLPPVAHLSLSELERRFRRYLQRTPKAELLRVRIEQAKRFLCDTDLALKIIAHRVGFSSEQYFSDAFRHHCGVRPLAYRRQHRGKG